MTVRAEYVPFAGGLDLISSSVTAAPGTLMGVQNFERVFGKQGYRRIDGYERFDGQPEPHKALPQSMQFKNGSSEIAPDDVICTTLAEGVVLRVDVESGSLAGGDAAGEIIFAASFGQWVPNTDIHIGTSSGPVHAKTDSASGDYVEPNQDLRRAYHKAAMSARRALIGKVPGDGPVRGVAVFKDVVLALRDASGGKTAALYKSSASGWVLLKAGLLPGGRLASVVGNFSGDTKKLALYMVDGVNGLMWFDGAALNFGPPVFGSEATSTSSLTVGTGAQTVTVVEAARSWQNGDALVMLGSGGEIMRGDVTSYTHPTLVLNVTSVEGSGTVAAWRISKQDAEDRPYLVTAHKDHLFLAYRRGQLQTSDLGKPLDYTGTDAALFGLGDEITGLQPMRGGVLGVFCETKIFLLQGSTSQDWQLEQHSQDVGAKLHTVQDSGGNALMLAPRGLVSLQATQTFGGFEPAVWSRGVTPYLETHKAKPIGARMVQGKYQYRLYHEDGSVLVSCVLSAGAVVQPKNVEITLTKLQHLPTCTTDGVWQGERVMLFGTQDGWVMREDVGPSFDGDVVRATLVLRFLHFKMPSNRKRFHKISMEVSSNNSASVQFAQVFDGADGVYERSALHGADLLGQGGAWGSAQWDSFAWSRPLEGVIEKKVDGIGRNMALILLSDSDIDEPVSLQGMMVHYAVLGMQR